MFKMADYYRDKVPDEVFADKRDITITKAHTIKFFRQTFNDNQILSDAYVKGYQKSFVEQIDE